MSAMEVTQSSPGANGELSRPGISPEFLRRHDIRRIQEYEAESLFGYRAAGIWIPYCGANSAQLVLNGRPFGRLRLDHPTNSGAKYLSPRDSGAQLYLPQVRLNAESLVIVEGEFKALALAESGNPAAGIGGISSAFRNGKLIPALSRILEKCRPKRVYFLGDNDTALNFEFSREAIKLAKALPEECELFLPRIPLSMPKGIDDCREQLGQSFPAFWNDITAAAIITKKSRPPWRSNSSPGSLAGLGALDKNAYRDKLVELASHMGALDAESLAKIVKEIFGHSITTFRKAAEAAAAERKERYQTEADAKQKTRHNPPAQ